MTKLDLSLLTSLDPDRLPDEQHHVQMITGVRFLPPGSSRTFELQVDCMSGAFIREAIDRGWTSGDESMGALKTAYEAGGSVDHGTPDQRLDAVILGNNTKGQDCAAAYLTDVER